MSEIAMKGDAEMGIKSLFGIRGARDKPEDRYRGPAYSFFFGRSSSGKVVNERTAMQATAVYSCVRILAEAVASLPVHLYRYAGKGKERVYDHPLYYLLHDEPNPEMTSFVFRETLMSHLLIWGNAYAQIIRDGGCRVLGLYPLLPDRVEVDRDDKGEIFMFMTGTVTRIRILGSTAGFVFGGRMCCISLGLGLTGWWGIRLLPWLRMRWG